MESPPALGGQPERAAQLAPSDALDPHNLVAGSLPADDPHPALRDAGALCDQLYQRRIGPPVDGRLGDPHDQRAVALTGDLRTRGTRLKADPQLGFGQ
jgi:hypothetical protein